MSRWLVALGCAIACSDAEASLKTEASCAGTASVPSAAPSDAWNPFAAHALAPEQRRWLEGSVEATLPAGSYVYVRVRTAEGDVWVASLSATTPRPLPERVRVLVVGSAESFHSRRLGRDFCPLSFGVIRADGTPPHALQKGTDS